MKVLRTVGLVLSVCLSSCRRQFEPPDRTQKSVPYFLEDDVHRISADVFPDHVPNGVLVVTSGGYAGFYAFVIWEDKDAQVNTILLKRFWHWDPEGWLVLDLTGGSECPRDLLDGFLAARDMMAEIDTSGKPTTGSLAEPDVIYTVVIKRGGDGEAFEVNEDLLKEKTVRGHPFFRAVDRVDKYRYDEYQPP